MNGISHDDGQFALDCWLDENDENDPVTEYSDILAPLQERAQIIFRAGRFGYLELLRWDADEQDWEELEVFGGSE